MRMPDCKSLTWVWPRCFLEALWYGIPPLPEVHGLKERTFRGQLRRDWLLHSTCLCVPAVVFIPNHLSLRWLLWARSYCLPVPLRSPQGRWKWNEVNIVPTSLFLIMCFLLKWPMMLFVWAQMEELGGLAFEQRFLNLISSNSPNDEKFFRKTEGSGSKAHGPISLWQQASALPNNSEKNLCRLQFLSAHGKKLQVGVAYSQLAVLGVRLREKAELFAKESKSQDCSLLTLSGLHFHHLENESPPPRVALSPQCIHVPV